MQDSFASRLRYFRAVKNLTQQELAKKAGISRKQISDLELGIQKNPRESTKIRLAEALDIDVLNLLSDLEPPLAIDPSIHTEVIELDLSDYPAELFDLVNQRAETSGRTFHEELNIILLEAISETLNKAKQDEIASKDDNVASRIANLEKQFAEFKNEQLKKNQEK